MRFRLSLLAFAAVLVTSLPVFAEVEGHDVYGQVQSFTWKEFDDRGNRLLEESGPLFGVGYTGRFLYDRFLTLKPRIELFRGTVDYDGQACDLFGNCSPYSTDTNYLGVKGEADLGLRFMTDRISALEPFAGLGYRWWERDIEGSATVSGLTERWSILYARLGIRALLFPGKHHRVTAEAAVKIPVANRESAEICISGTCKDVTLRPGKEKSYYAELGYRIRRFRLLVFYESLRFSQSDPETNVINNISVTALQPESKADIFGIQAGIVF